MSKPSQITNESIKNADNAEILWQVYKLESSRGKNDGCRNRGLYNGFGYGQPDSAMADGTGACFETFEEVVDKVDNWFTRQLKTKTLPEALCFYNTGKAESGCTYYTDKYLKW